MSLFFGPTGSVATPITILNGGTGQTTKAAGFDALQPMTTGGDIIYGGASGTGIRLANGSLGQVLTSGGLTNAPTWSTIAGLNSGVQSKTSAYNILTSDSLVMCSASGGAFSVTLPSASGNLGLIIRIQKTDFTFNAVTETVTGKTLNTQFETRTFQSDGSNWQLINWDVDTSPNSFTPSIVTATGTLTGGTATGKWSRYGAYIFGSINLTFNSAVGTWSKVSFGLPFTMDTSAFPVAPTADITYLGDGSMFAGSPPALKATYFTSTSIVPKRVVTSSGSNPVNTDVSFNIGSGDVNTTTILNLDFKIPIAGWGR